MIPYLKPIFSLYFNNIFKIKIFKSFKKFTKIIVLIVIFVIEIIIVNGL